jgi:hypothetical protein
MFKNRINAVRSLVAAGALAAGTSVMAAMPAGAETAITEYGTDVKTAIGLVIAAGIGIFAVRKLGQKMGWL